jgi:tetratricopeptide (TPR) repeat protein
MTARLILIGIGGALAVMIAAVLPRLADTDRFDAARSLLADGRAYEAALLFDDPLWRGAAEYRAGRYQRAGEAFGEAEDATAHYNRGNVLAKLGHWADARRAYQAALRLKPDHGDALHNLELVEAAETLADQLAEAERNVRQADTDSATDAISKEGETATEDPDGGSRRSVGDATADEDDSQVSGEASRPGRAAERDATETATGATATLRGGSDAETAQIDGTGAATILRDSGQEAEILLRQIKDDPARVLRARLRAAHEIRQKGADE